MLLISCCPALFPLSETSLESVCSQLTVWCLLCSLCPAACGAAGVLRDPEGARGQLAVPDVRAGRAAQVPAVPQEGRRHEAHPERHQVGARQLCSLDSRGGCSPFSLGEGKKTH